MTLHELEQHMARSLEGKFFHYVGKAEELSPAHLAALAREAAKREKASREAAAFENEQPKFSGEMTGKQILAAVAYVHRVPVDEIKGKSRKKSFALARHHLVWELRKRKTNYSLPMIGKMLHRDHTTILNSLDFMQKNGHSLDSEIRAVAHILDERRNQ
jgi:chromosomal replication initiation ATPase DnaA